MRDKIYKSIFILVFVILTPLVFYFVYQIGSLNKNEKMIKEVYTSQLKTILGSVNQYSDDAIRNLTSKINDEYSYNSDLNNIVGEFSFIKQLIIFNTNKEPSYTLRKLTKLDKKVLKKINKKQLFKLREYIKANYKKIEHIKINNLYEGFLFVLSKNKEYSFAIMIANTKEFVYGVMGPKIQRVSDQKFHISVCNSNNEQIFGNYNLNKDEVSEDLWFVNKGKIRIKQIEKTISDIVKERSKIQIYILIFIIIIVIVGVFFMANNINKTLKLAKLKSEFLSNISHEIRTPLTLISMYSETLNMGRIKETSKLNKYYTVIYDETERLTLLVNKMLNFTRLEKGKKELNFAEINLSDIIDKIINLKSFNNKKEYVKIEVNKSSDNIKIYGDEVSVGEALYNLVDNAIKYSNKSKTLVKVKAFPYQNKVILEVEDNGLGISDEDKQYIFEKFYRVTNGDIANNVKGTGIGLNIVKEIMKNHNGEIKVESKLGKGSKFRLVFPKKNKLCINY